MVYKTRSYDNYYDMRTWSGGANGPPWSVNGGSIEVHPSTITAEYLERDWKRLIWLGQNATTYMSGSKSGFRKTPIGDELKAALAIKQIDQVGLDLTEAKSTSMPFFGGVPSPPGATQRVRGCYWGQGLVLATDDPTFITKVEARALVKFNQKVLKAQQDLQGQIALGEFGETLRMIRSPAKALRSGVRDYYQALIKRGRRNRNRRPEAIHRIASDTWLEYSFGWRPFISDVEDGLDALVNSFARPPPRKFVKGEVNDRKTAPGTQSSDASQQQIGIVRLKEVRHSLVGVKFYGVVGVPQPTGSFDPSRFGINSWSNILPTVWELIPYSFLVDYFSNIGGIIESYSSTYADVKWIAKGIVTLNESSWSDLQITSTEIGGVWKKTDFWSHPGEKCYKVRRTVYRDTYTGIRVPPFIIKVPDMGTKWVNMAALAFSNRKALYALRGR